jgi:hypothetical protein
MHLSRVRRIPGLRSLQFDVNLLPYNDLAATRVTARMISVGEIVCHHIDQVPNLAEPEVAKRNRASRGSRHLRRCPSPLNNVVTSDNERIKTLSTGKS